MLEKITKLSVDKEQVLPVLIRSLSWHVLVDIIKTSSLRKHFEKGGFRWEKQNFDRAEMVLKASFANDPKKTESLENELFMAWYEKHSREDFREQLETYLHSEEYKEWVKTQEISDTEYALPDSKLEEFSQDWSLQESIFIAFYSRIRFTKQQVEKILDIGKCVNQNANRPNPVKREPNTQDSTKKTERLKKQLRKKNQRLDTEIEKTKNLQRALKESNTNRLACEAELQDFKKQQQAKQEEWAREKKRINIDSERATKQNRESQNRYQDLERKKAEKEKELNAKNLNLVQTVRDHQIEIKQLQNQLQNHKLWDWLFGDEKRLKDILKQINIKNSIRESIIEKIKIPDYDTNDNKYTGSCLSNLWNDLLQIEKKRVDRINSIIENPENENTIIDQWPNTEDLFLDVKFLLEARWALIELLHHILEQTAKEAESQKVKALNPPASQIKAFNK